MNTKERYTISEATALLGFKSRSTINKRTKSTGGDSISFEIDENGAKVISIIELQRVFPDRIKTALHKNERTPDTSAEYSAKTQRNTPKNTVNTVWLAEKVDLLQEQLEREQGERQRERQEFREREQKGEDREEKLQTQNSELIKTISQQTRLLEHHQKPTILETSLPEKKSSNRVLSETSKELTKALKFSAFASMAIATLLLVAYLFQGQPNQPSNQKKVTTQKALSEKRKSPERSLQNLDWKKKYKNYTPIPE